MCTQPKNLLFHLYFERWKLKIDKYNRLREFMETCQMLNYTPLYLNYKILWIEIWNMSPEIFWKMKYGPSSF